MSIYKEGVNPARALYRFWDSILTGIQASSTPFGVSGWGISRSGNAITYGYHDRFNGYHTPWFILTLDGRFALDGVLRGYRRRSDIARGTFLNYGHTHSRYQWFVDLDHEKGRHYHYYGASVSDWQNPRAYISEDLIGCRTWQQSQVMLKLVRRDDAWVIRPARKQDPSSLADCSLKDYRALCEQFDHYERLVAQRYRKAEWRATQEDPWAPREVSVRTPTLRDGSQVLDHNESITRLVAMLDVSQPAKTTPLTRPKEAQHGTDQLDPTPHL